MTRSPNPSRTAESWLPGVTTTCACSASRASASDRRATASTGGIARSYTSPATTTASTPSVRVSSTRWSRCAAWCSSRSTPCSVRPRCQSDVCRMRMPAPYRPGPTAPGTRERGARGAGSDGADGLDRAGRGAAPLDRDAPAHADHVEELDDARRRVAQHDLATVLLAEHVELDDERDARRVDEGDVRHVDR